MLVAPACLHATVGIAKEYRDALESQSELNIGYLALEFIGTIRGVAIILLAVLATLVGFAIGWEWCSAKRWLARQIRADEQCDEPKSR